MNVISEISEPLSKFPMQPIICGVLGFGDDQAGAGSAVNNLRS
jgi:hypothetical protein